MPSQVPHQGQISLSQHKGRVLGYLCQLYANDGTNPNGIKAIQWQITHHGKAWLVMKTLE
jgi:hypothetical protein